MTAQIQIVSGFLGAGKTTFLNHYLPMLNGKTVVIENEAGTVGVDGALLPGDFPVRELSAGCICCTLAPALREQLEQIEVDFAPDTVVIEPSGVGNLSDIVHHCERFGHETPVRIAMLDVSEFEDYVDAFGMFYMDQINNANLILFTHTQGLDDDLIERVAARIRETNETGLIQKSDWRELSKEELLALVSQAQNVTMPEIEHHHHHHDHDFKNNGFDQWMFTDLLPWEEGFDSKLAGELNSGKYGEVYRAKGFNAGPHGVTYFDFTPQYMETKLMGDGTSVGELRMIIIGRELDTNALEALLCGKVTE